MKALILGLNYAPEPVGVGPYTTGLAQWLAGAGHQVSVVCAKPYYPYWRIDRAYRGLCANRSTEYGVNIVRLPVYVPKSPNGTRRLLHHLSFAMRALPTLLNQIWRGRPDVIIAIAPSMVSVVLARVISRILRIKLWIHIQDFEVDAALATQLLPNGGMLEKVARAVEKWSLGADQLSAISPQMCARLKRQGIAPHNITELRNWATISTTDADCVGNGYRQDWGIETPHVALYSGSIGNKQGLDLIVEAACLLQNRGDLTFVICGTGPEMIALEKLAQGSSNIKFFPLQPENRLGELLSIATIHLLPQIAGAADLLLPSKLINMLASGRPIIATAAVGTGIASEVEGCGLIVPPGNSRELAAAIDRLLDEPAQRLAMGARGMARVHERWAKASILTRFEMQLRELAA